MKISKKVELAFYYTVIAAFICADLILRYRGHDFNAIENIATACIYILVALLIIVEVGYYFHKKKNPKLVDEEGVNDGEETN